MIYPSRFPPDNVNFAEEKVYQALSELPSDDFDVFFRKTFSGKTKGESDDYEVDFIIIDKRGNRFNAILLAEVKGGKLRYSGSEGCWFQNNHRMALGPDDQARKNKSNLRKRFENIIANVPVHWIIWFPEGVYSGFEAPVNVNRWQIFDHRSLAETPHQISAAFNLVREKRQDLAGEEIGIYTERLKTSLLRSVGIIQPLNILLKQYEEKYLQLESDQKVFFESLTQQKRLAVSGGAGSGKTMLAGSAAADFGNEGKKVLLLCFNRMLFNALDATLSGKEVTVSTFHTFAYNYVARDDPKWLEKNPERDREFHMTKLPGKFRQTLQKFNPPRYDVLIIDEAQDFEESWIEMIFRFTSKNSHIILFYDENQNIFNRNFHIPDFGQFFHFHLKHNFRNTKRICEFVEQYTGLPLISRNTPEGIDVDVTSHSNTDELVRNLGLALLNLVQIQHISLADIVIIVDGHLDGHPLHDVPNISNYRLNPWDVNSSRNPDELYFTSISRFKGMESNVVLLVLDEPAGLMANKVFYTQCTRAKSILKVFWKG